MKDKVLIPIEQYFDAAGTPLEQRIDIATTYLRGDDFQWWRDSRFFAENLRLHRFCSYMTKRFVESSICDNVMSFHLLTRVSIY